MPKRDRPIAGRLRSMLAVAILIFGFSVTLMAAPASADAPYAPKAYQIVNCYANETYASCQRLNTSTVCVASDTECFATQTGKTWWLNMQTRTLCAGTDKACLNTYGDVMWFFDHDTPGPDVADDERLKLDDVPTTVKPVDINLQGTGSCGTTVNDFKICNVVTLSNGLEFLALAVCMVGIFVSCVLWALGSKGQNPGQELTGKRGLILCCVAAFVVGIVPSMVTFANDRGRDADTSGITHPSN